MPFRDGMDFLAERMNACGYATAAFGKLHHMPSADTKGFRYARQYEEGRLGRDEPYLQWLQARHPEVTRMSNFCPEAMVSRFPAEEYYEHWIASEAMAYFQNQTENKQQSPLFTLISFQGPHTPYDPPAEYKGTCRRDRLPKPLNGRPLESLPQIVQRRRINNGLEDETRAMRCREAYAEMIVAIDHQIGRILGTLQDLGLYEDTVFIFTSDHGDMLGDYGLDKKGPFPYRGSMAIPLIIAGDERLRPGARCDWLASNLDIGATALALAGDDEPLGNSWSLLDLAGEHAESRREANYSEFCDSMKFVETERYRFAFYPFTSEMELYDVKEDPDESTNLAGHPEFAATCVQMLQRVVDFGILARGAGPRWEAQDAIHPQQESLRALSGEKAIHQLPVAFPLSTRAVRQLQDRGFPSDYNEWCRGKEVLKSYHTPCWLDEQPQ
jgi:arylsulfatase A-like enzyme